MRDRSHARKAQLLLSPNKAQTEKETLLPSEWSHDFTELISDDNQKRV